MLNGRRRRVLHVYGEVSIDRKCLAAVQFSAWNLPWIAHRAAYYVFADLLGGTGTCSSCGRLRKARVVRPSRLDGSIQVDVEVQYLDSWLGLCTCQYNGGPCVRARRNIFRPLVLPLTCTLFEQQRNQKYNRALTCSCANGGSMFVSQYPDPDIEPVTSAHGEGTRITAQRKRLRKQIANPSDRGRSLKSGILLVCRKRTQVAYVCIHFRRYQSSIDYL